ncbi:hypothetical protein [Nocardioides gansuensis]|uniref:hypothetical protein n=1 Tax=Nocardioides gansuensis TaxID=2138300 RepID=UPI001401C99E|nr:hypothetical protein [Nocardioides gansuensis]
MLIDDLKARELILADDVGNPSDPIEEGKLKFALRTVAGVARQVSLSESRWGW